VFGGSLGAYAEFICVPNNNLQHIPKQWDFVSAASLGATVPVSYGALVIRGELKKGETVLIHASARGLGLCAVQIAKGELSECGVLLEKQISILHTGKYFQCFVKVQNQDT